MHTDRGQVYEKADHGMRILIIGMRTVPNYAIRSLSVVVYGLRGETVNALSTTNGVITVWYSCE